MADSDEPIVEQVLEPSPFGLGAAAPEHYPFLFSFQGEDVLELTTWNSAAGVEVTIQGRIHRSTLKVTPFTHKHISNTDRSAKTTIATIGRGELLNCIAYVSAGAPGFGQTFVRVAVRRGAGTAFERLGVLIQGPISANVARAFPGSVVLGPFEAEPYLRTITGATPAGAAEIVETVPTGARWELLTCRYVMVTGGTAINRFFNFQIKNGATRRYRTLDRTAINAGVTVEHFIAQNIPVTTDASAVAFTLPMPSPAILTAAETFGTFSQFIQAGDQFTAPLYTVREWLDI